MIQPRTPDQPLYRRALSLGNLPTRGDLIMYEGDDFFLVLEVYDEEDQAADLSDAVPRSQIRQTTASTQDIRELEASLEENVITLHATHALTTGLPLRSVWDVQVTYPSGLVQTLMFGSVSVTPEVTR